MADELKHKDIGTQLTKTEFEDVTLHQLDSQATGDLIKAVSGTQLSRLPIGVNDKVLTVVSGVPAWADAPAATLEEDTTTSGVEADTGTLALSYYGRQDSIAAGVEYTIASCSTAYTAGSMAVGSGFICARADASTLKLRLYMDGVMAAESAFFTPAPVNYVVVGTKALSGTKVVACRVHNSTGGAVTLTRATQSSSQIVPGGVAAGSIKVA